MDSEKRVVVVKFGKKVTVAVIRQYAENLLAHPLFRPSFSEIVDLSEVEELDLQADDFLRLADDVDPFSREARRAFVVCNSVQHHAARMHKALRSQEIEIFDSLQKAERWLSR